MSTSRAVIALFILAAVLFLGVQRLQVGKPPRHAVAPTDSAGACLPPVDIPAGTSVSLAHPALEGQAARLRVVSTAPITLDVPDAAGAPGPVALGGRPLRLARTGGSTFELELPQPQGALVLRKGSGSFRLERAGRFAPVAEAVYLVQAAPDLQAERSGGKATIAPNTLVGEVLLDQPLALATVQPLLLRMWPPQAPPSLAPTRVVGQTGLADVAIAADAFPPGLDIARQALVACAWSEGKGKWLPVGVIQQATAGKVKLSLPDEVLPQGIHLKSTPVYLAVASADGTHAVTGGLHMMSHGMAAVIATLFTALLLGSVMYARGQKVKDAQDRPRWFAGLFLGVEGTPSLSLLQIFIWTLITLWGFVYVYIVAGDLLALTQEMMWLLGIAGAGTVLARWIASSNMGPAPTETGVFRTAGGTCDTDFWAMLQTDGRFDLLKLQLFAFTIVIALYVLFRIADAAAFPALDTNTLLLLGVSQGVYITGKLAQKSDLSSAWAVRAQMDVMRQQREMLDHKLAAAQARLLRAQSADPPDAAAVTAAEKAVQALQRELQAHEAHAAELEADYSRKLEALQLRPL